MSVFRIAFESLIAKTYSDLRDRGQSEINSKISSVLQVTFYIAFNCLAIWLLFLNLLGAEEYIRYFDTDFGIKLQALGLVLVWLVFAVFTYFSYRYTDFNRVENKFSLFSKVYPFFVMGLFLFSFLALGSWK